MLDTQLAVVASAERRQILTALREKNPRQISEFAHVESSQLTDDTRLRLHHVHLPKLEAHGFITWDPDSQTLTRGPQFDEIEPLLQVLHRNRDDLPVEPS